MTDEQIIEALNITEASEDFRIATVDQVRAIVEMRLLGAVSEALSDDLADEFEEVQATGDDSATQQWIESKLGNIEELREGVTRDYITERLEASVDS